MKKSSYQKLKEENKKLKEDIYRLVMEPEKLETLAVFKRYRFKFEMVKTCLYGSNYNKKFLMTVMNRNSPPKLSHVEKTILSMTPEEREASRKEILGKCSTFKTPFGDYIFIKHEKLEK